MSRCSLSRSRSSSKAILEVELKDVDGSNGPAANGSDTPVFADAELIDGPFEEDAVEGHISDDILDVDVPGRSSSFLPRFLVLSHVFRGSGSSSLSEASSRSISLRSRSFPGQRAAKDDATNKP